MENVFQQKKYKVIKGLIDPEKLYNYVTDLKNDGKLRSDDSGINLSTSLAVYKDPTFEKLLVDLMPVIEEHAGCPLYKTFSSGRYFKKGHMIRARKNEYASEICVTICLGYEEKPWPIGFMDEDYRTQSVTLEPGDALMYKGPEIMYWRSKNTFGDCGQLFLYYVNQNGPFAIYKDDHNPNAKRNSVIGRLGNCFGNFKLFK